ncbi:hypothetical protein SEA_REYNAULD_45 [Rhodococcus phage Reynauld]|uniref:Uncharacterized protein n=1 Tax=Rhodococcus phage Reynauld TaxID=3062845 RepID=A0ACD4UI85_9CAUD|nr:hypothetical protein SEA_REYNAULD_45 [Rhodococcus phage Reynauld]
MKNKPCTCRFTAPGICPHHGRVTESPSTKREREIADCIEVLRDQGMEWEGVVRYLARVFEIKPDAADVTPVEPRTPEAQLLADATATINGARQDAYGDAEDSFQVIADFWRIYLESKYDVRLPGLNAVDTALMLDLFKTARLTQTEDHRDSFLDKAGYTGLAWRSVVKGKTKEENSNG